MLAYKKIFAALLFISLFFSYSWSQESSLTLSNISAIRSSKIGSVVKIKGTITVPSGYFASSIPFGYAIQDESAGIYVVDTTETLKGEYQIGDEVIATGVRSDSYGLSTIIEIESTKITEDQNVIPKKVKTGFINESSEGLLISTSGKIKELRNDAPYGYKVYIDDGSGMIDIYINTSTGMIKDTSEWDVDMTISVTGFSSQYNSEYECDPRFSEDIKIEGN